MRPRLLTLALGLLLLTCRGPEPVRPTLKPGGDDPSKWLTIYDPNAASNGFMLAAYRRQYPVLVNMRGEFVRAWPEARLKSRIRLTEECTLLGLSKGRGVVEYDWEGNKIWSVRFEERYAHHDVIRTGADTVLVITRRDGELGDDVLEIDRSGNVVWEWQSLEPLRPFIEAGGGRQAGDPVHLNSVRELPENPWFDAGDPRFRPGNLLLSARNLDLAFIVDRQSGEIVWSYGENLDLQHEAVMIEPGFPGHGNIMIYNNRYASFMTDRLTHVIEIQPVTGEVVWRYSEPGFYSATSGVQEPLPNGNVFIVSSTAGRAFEVDRSGRIVWEWAAPFRLNRPNRYAPDHCPQLASVGPPDGPPVRPPRGYRHFDFESYRFARPGHRREVSIDGTLRPVLRRDHRCAPLRIPQDAKARLRFGIDQDKREELGLDGYSATFSISLTNPETGGSAVVFEETLGPETRGWRQRHLDLGALAYKRIEMCVGLEERGLAGGVEPGTLAFWGPPTIRRAQDLEEEEQGLEGHTDLTPEELEVQLEHLRAMGYVN